MATQAKVSQEALLVLVQTTPAARLSQVALLVLMPVSVTHQGSGAITCAASVSGAGFVLGFGVGALLGQATVSGTGIRLAGDRVVFPMRTTEELFTVGMSEEAFEIRQSEAVVTVRVIYGK
jgi:hypothetical protein